MPERETIDWRRELRSLLDRSKGENTWVSGKMELVLNSGETIEGTLERLEHDAGIAVMSTPSGEQRVEISEVVDAERSGRRARAP